MTVNEKKPIALTTWDKLWKDKNGKVVIWQSPNLPLWVWIFSTIINKVLPHGQLNLAIGLISFGALFTWAWLELFQGVNYFRRILGLVVIVASVAARI